MNTDTHHTSDRHELAHRNSNGLDVRLIWERSTNTVSVCVHDELLDEEVELVVGPGTSPLSVYTHPFAYAAWRGIARTQLLLGEHLRRERRRLEARDHLRAAADGFEALGAEPWAERARSELRATGETVRKRDPSTVDELTPQELQIARLVAEGGSNKDVAAQLFLGPRTVEYHLRKVFAKLEITSRAELIRRGAATAAQEPATLVS